MALRGIKVIELAGLAPAPFCGMILADFGATVLRVDKIGSNTNLDCLANGKKSIALNLKNPGGIRILRDLCRKSDVVLEPFRKGVMESLGLGPEILLKDNPKLIYARLTGYGQSGSYSARAGHDINYVGLSGILSLFGRHGAKPLPPVNLAADFGGGGMTCALGIVMALLERTGSGLGQLIDCNMVEGTAYLGSWLYRSQPLPIWGRERGQNVLDSGAHFYDVYETKDKKYMCVGALEPQFYSELLRVLNISEEELPQYSDFVKGKKVLTEVFLSKTQDEWRKLFDDVDACVTPLLTLEEAPKHEHNALRESFVPEHETKEYVPKPAPVFSRTKTIATAALAPPIRGQHSLEVLKDLGYSQKEIGKLQDEGVVEIAVDSKL